MESMKHDLVSVSTRKNNNRWLSSFQKPEVRFRSKTLSLKVLVVTTNAQWEGMGDVGLAKYELALLPPCPTIRVLSYSN